MPLMDCCTIRLKISGMTYPCGYAPLYCVVFIFSAGSGGRRIPGFSLKNRQSPPLLLPVQSLPGEIRSGLDIMDHGWIRGLSLGVDGDDAGSHLQALYFRQLVAYRLRILAAALDRIGYHHDGVVGMRVDMRGNFIGAVLGLERLDEVLHHRTLLVRIELDDTDIAE